MSTPTKERFNVANWPRCQRRGCDQYGKVSTHGRFYCDEHLPKRVLTSVLAARAAFAPVDRNKEHDHA